MSDCPLFTLLGPWLWYEAEDGWWGPPAGCRGAIDLASHARILAATPGKPRGVGIFRCESIPADWEGVVLSGEDLRDTRPDGRMLEAWESFTGYPPAGETLAECLWDHLTQGAGQADDGDRCGMLIPTQRRRLQLWLGGCLRDEPFDIRTHSLAPRLRECLSQQLSRLREEALAGRLVSPAKGAVDPCYHRRIADALLEKYAGSNSRAKAELFAAIKPSTWDPDEGPLAHATILTESFNKADSTTLGPDQTWTEVLGNLQVASNACTVVGASATECSGRVESDLSSTDVYCQGMLAVGTTQTNRYAGPSARYASGADTCYHARQLGGASGNGTFQLFKVIAGTSTALGSGSSRAQVAMKRLECSGTSIAIFSAGSLIETVVDTAIDGAITGGRRAGLRLRDINSGFTYDAWEAGDLSAVGQPTIRRWGAIPFARPWPIGQTGVRGF